MANEIKIKLTIDGKEATATLDLSDKKLKQLIATSGTAKTSTDSLTLGFQKMASALIGLFAITKVTGFLKDSVMAFAQEEQTISMLRESVGGATEGIVAYAKELEALTGIEDDQIMMASKMIGDFVKNEDMIKKITKATLDFAAAKRMDVVSASNMVIRALVGESNTLGKVKLNIDENIKGNERYNQILKAMSNLFGGQAEAAASGFTGTMNKMKRSIDNLKEAIGEKLSGTLAVFAEKITDITKKGTESKSVFMSIEIIARTLGIVFAGLTQIIVTVGTVLGSVFGLIGKVAYELPSIIEGLAKASQGNLMGGVIAGNAVDNITASFNAAKKSFTDVQEAYAKFYNLMLNPRAQLGEVGTGTGDGSGNGGFIPTEQDKLIRYDKEIQKEIALTEAKLKGNLSERERVLLKEKLKSLQDELIRKEQKSISNDELAKGSAEIFARDRKKRIDDYEKELQLKREEADLQAKISELQQGDPWGDYLRNIDRQADNWDVLKKNAQDTMQTITIGFLRAKMYGEDFNQTLKNIVNQFLDMGIMAVFSGLFSVMGGGTFGEGFMASLGIKGKYAGGIINEPILGVGLNSGTLHSFGEKGYEMVRPLHTVSTIGSGGRSELINLDLTIRGEFAQKGKDLHAVVKAAEKIIKRYK